MELWIEHGILHPIARHSDHSGQEEGFKPGIMAGTTTTRQRAMCKIAIDWLWRSDHVNFQLQPKARLHHSAT